MKGFSISRLESKRPVLVALLGTALVVGGAEFVVSRWLASAAISMADARYGWVFQPHARVVSSTEGWSVRHTNSMGLLDDELRSPRARVRGVLLGDSFAEALQVAQDADFESVAERRVPGLEVVNAGHSGRSPVQYALWLEEYGPRLAPDVVIVQLGDWDLADVIRHASAERRAAAARGAVERVAGAGDDGLLVRLWRRLAGHSALVGVTWRRTTQLLTDSRAQLAKRIHGAGAPTNDPAPPALADPRLAALMDSLHLRLAAHAPRLIYLYLPEVDYFGSRHGYRDPPTAAFLHAFATRNHATLVDPIAEFLEEFRRTGQPLHGFQNSVLGEGHLNAVGHRVAGEQLARAIAEAIR
jgi:hypothetical protein